MPDEATPAPAFYALRGGGWRDWWTLLHPPYTLWHLSFVALGAASAPRIRLEHLAATVLAFFLAVGIGAHALDELNGRPLKTAIPARVLRALAGLAVATAIGLGIVGTTRLGLQLVPFILFGGGIVYAYNLELARGRFHTDAWFAIAWGAFPALTGHFSQAGTLDAAGILVAAGCAMTAAAQRALSTPVRALRRRTARVEGIIERTDGVVEPIARDTLTRPAETALRALSFAMPLLAAGAVAARV